MARIRKKGLSPFPVIVLMLAAAVVSGAAVYIWQNPGLFSNTTAGTGMQPSRTVRENVQSKADMVLHTLKDKNVPKLAEYVHPDKGLRFSPYSYITEKDVVIPASQLSEETKKGSKRLWGVYDGSGEPIELTFGEYFDKFVYAKDYLDAPEIIFNLAVQRGNSLNNVKEAFPGSASIEYYFPGFEKQYEGMDWRSLTLVFEQKDTTWYLVALVNNQWTI